MTSPAPAPSRPSRAWAWVLPGLLLVAVAVVALLLLTGAGDPADADGVAGDPAAYDGQEVVLSGTVAEAPGSLPAGAPAGAFVLAGEGGGRLLVIPGADALERDLAQGASVEVAGTVRAPEAAADGRAPEEPPLTRTELLGLTGTRAVVEAEQVSP